MCRRQPSFAPQCLPSSPLGPCTMRCAFSYVIPGGGACVAAKSRSGDVMDVPATDWPVVTGQTQNETAFDQDCTDYSAPCRKERALGREQHSQTQSRTCRARLHRGGRAIGRTRQAADWDKRRNGNLGKEPAGSPQGVRREFAGEPPRRKRTGRRRRAGRCSQASSCRPLAWPGHHGCIPAVVRLLLCTQQA